MRSARQPWISVVLGSSLVLGLAAIAHGWTMPAGWRGDDYQVLELARSAPWNSPGASGLGVLTHLSLWVSHWVWGVNSLGWRLESIFWLVVAATGWSAFTRRFLLPWTGSDHARVAGLVSGVLLAVHPLNVAVVGSLASRGELLGFCAIAWSGAAFLRGRQDRRVVFTASAVCLGILGAFASDSLVLLPLLLLSAEIVSSHRYRPWAGRFRTGVTTGLVFGAAVVLGLLGSRAVRSAIESGGAQTVFGQLDPVAQVQGFGALRGLGALGRLVLPVDGAGLGALGLIAAGALFLVAVQPAATAARSAPRLWGWLSFGWVVAMLAGVLVAERSLTLHEGFDLAWNFLPAVGFACFGLAASVTALSGFLRRVLAAVLVLGYVGLSVGNAQAYRAAGAETKALMQAVAEAHQDGVQLWVVEPPVLVDGVRAVGTSLGWLTGRLDLSNGSLRGVPSASLDEQLSLAAAGDRIDLLVPDLAHPAHWVVVPGHAEPDRGADWSWREEFRSPLLEER